MLEGVDDVVLGKQHAPLTKGGKGEIQLLIRLDAEQLSLGETIHLQNADASGKRIASLPHELLTLRTGEPEQSPLLCIVAHDLDGLEDLREPSAPRRSGSAV